MSKRGFAAVIVALVPLASCKHSVEIEPVRIEPIHLTVDLNVKVDRKLDQFFDYEEAAPEGQPETNPDTEGAT